LSGVTLQMPCAIETYSKDSIRRDSYDLVQAKCDFDWNDGRHRMAIRSHGGLKLPIADRLHCLRV
jgi:hypothetical protein